MKMLNSFQIKLGLIGLAATSALLAQPPAGMRGFGGRGRGFGFPGGIFHSVVTGAPFSATETTQTKRTLANGNLIQNQHQSKIYRDAQGRVRIESTFTPPSSSGGAATTQTRITIYDPVAGFVYHLNPATMTAVQSPLPAKDAQTGGKAPAAPSTGAPVQTQSLGTSTINGVNATGTQVTRTIAAGTIGNSADIQIVRVTWLSTDLKIPVQLTVSDPRFGTSTMNLTDIVQAAPDASLFQVPAGYTMTKASGRWGNRPAFHN